MADKNCEDFLSLVKSYLNVRGVATSGYSKVALVAKPFSVSEMNLPIVMSSVEHKQSLIKACVRYFLSNFYFSSKDSPSKSLKNVFYFI